MRNDWQGRLGRQVKLRELRVLLAIAEEGSFRKAAAQLHITQPAITMAVADLENTLGVRLFERTSRGVAPTAHGEAIILRAHAIFGELGRAAEDIAIISQGSRQTLRVGVGGGGWTQGILPTALAKLLDPQLDASVQLREADEDVLLEQLKARKLDVYLSRLAPMRADPDLAFHPLFEDSICVLARRDHRLAGRKRVPWEALADERWVTPQREALSFDHIQRTLHQGGLSMPRHVIESASAPVALGMVLQADFLCFGTFHYYAHTVLKSMLAMLDVRLPRVPVPFGAVTLREREPNPLVLRLTRIVADLARASDGGTRA